MDNRLSLSEDSDNKIIISTDKWIARPTNIAYYTEHQHPKLATLFEEPDLKAAGTPRTATINQIKPTIRRRVSKGTWW